MQVAEKSPFRSPIRQDTLVLGLVQPRARTATLSSGEHGEGQRTNLDQLCPGCRGWRSAGSSHKGPDKTPDLSCRRSGFREERLGSGGNRHLNNHAESTVSNLTGLPQTEASSAGETW